NPTIPRPQVSSAALLAFFFFALLPVRGESLDIQSQRTLLNQYCLGCHNQKAKTGGISIEGVDVSTPAAHADLWERVVRKVRSGQMPPPGLPHPDGATATAFAKSVEEALDKAAAAAPNPGRTAPHRLNCAEYSNAIRDLLDL